MSYRQQHITHNRYFLKPNGIFVNLNCQFLLMQYLKKNAMKILSKQSQVNAGTPEEPTIDLFYVICVFQQEKTATSKFRRRCR